MILEVEQIVSFKKFPRLPPLNIMANASNPDFFHLTLDLIPLHSLVG
jgi:hypothetical protein